MSDRSSLSEGRKVRTPIPKAAALNKPATPAQRGKEVRTVTLERESAKAPRDYEVILRGETYSNVGVKRLNPCRVQEQTKKSGYNSIFWKK